MIHVKSELLFKASSFCLSISCFFFADSGSDSIRRKQYSPHNYISTTLKLTASYMCYIMDKTTIMLYCLNPTSLDISFPEISDDVN